MKNKIALFLLITSILSFGFPSLPVKSEAKFISGYTDGLLSTYAIIEFNGIKYKTDESGSRTNTLLWNQLNDDDKRQLMKYYWSPNTRKADFGPASAQMASWANDVQGWSKLVDALKQKRANKNYPDLKAFYEKPLEMPTMRNVSCTAEVQNCELAKEAGRLHAEIKANYAAGQGIYKKLVDIKWDQVGVAVKGISANLIPIIVDNFITSSITGISSVAINKMSPIIASLIQVSNSAVEFAKNNPNDAAELIKKLDSLCDTMEADAKTARAFVEQDQQKLQAIYEQLAIACEQDALKKQSIAEQKKADLENKMKVISADTGLEITSTETNAFLRNYEISVKAKALLDTLLISKDDAIKEMRVDYDQLILEYRDVVKFTPLKVCGGNFFENGVSPECFTMNYSVSEITEWDAAFPKTVSIINSQTERYKIILEKAKTSRGIHIEKVKLIQSKIIELSDKYSKYLEYNPGVERIEPIFADYNNFIESLEERIPALELTASQAETGQKTVREGLTNRIKKERDGAVKYKTLEANFVNSIDQIKDAVYKSDNIYASEEFIFLDKIGHKPMVNKEKIKSFSIDAKRADDIKVIINRLKEKQKEQNHQIKRLILGQNNAVYDSQLLQDFLAEYTDGLIYTHTAFEKIKADVSLVTGVSLKHPYYDVVVDRLNGDYSLWMKGSGSSLKWMLDPETLRLDIDSLIEEFKKIDKDNQSYKTLEKILSNIQASKTTFINLDRREFEVMSRGFSDEVQKIVKESNSGGANNEQLARIHKEIATLLEEIDTANRISEKEKETKRLIAVIPEIQKQVQEIDEEYKRLEQAQKIESRYIFERMIKDLQNHTRAISDMKQCLDSSKTDDLILSKSLDKLNEQIYNLISKVSKTMQQLEINNKREENNLVQNSIKDLYANFKQAYESKSESQVVRFISNEWESADGSTISDLEINLRRIFNVFDNINYNISNLNIVSIDENTFRVNYDVEITGVNYERNLTHKEKSSVSEEVTVTPRGGVKINKTLNGRFWYIE